MVLVSAEGPGILAADTWRIADADGLPYAPANPSTTFVGGSEDGKFTFDFSYQWIRVDGETDTNIGADSPRYQLVDADFGKKIKVQVSFTDQEDNDESVTSVPFGPIVRPAPLPLPGTLVGNTGQSPSATATITGDYAMRFKLGTHGQGYEISSVSIDLAAAPSSLSVSLWTGGPPGSSYANTRIAKLFEFENPASFQVGLNEFTAPAGVYAYHNLDHWIVLSGFGSSLSITETTSDAEDAGGEPGAELADIAGGDTNVLRLAVNGSRRTTGILAANFTYPRGNQEILSLGDNIGWGIDVGAADRYLIRGLTLNGDDTTTVDGGFDNPFSFRSDSLSGTKHFDLFQTRNVNGLPVWTAPQGATVAGSNTYVFHWQINEDRVNGDDTIDRIGAVLQRVQQVHTDADGESDQPPAPGVSLHVGESLANNDAAGPTPFMAVHGVPLHAMVQNLGQTDRGYRSVGGTNKVLSQGFTTGSNPGVYVLQGIGVNIEGSGGNVPDGSASVSVAVHADSGGKPGAKLFDLLSPTEFAAGHSFFEAPRGTELEESTSYVMVWSHLGGTVHRMRKTGSNSEDSGALTGFSIANTFYQGADIDNMAADSATDVLEIAVYGSIGNHPPTSRPAVYPSAEGAGILLADTFGIEDPNGVLVYSSQDSAFTRLEDWTYRWIRVDGETKAETVIGADSLTYQPVDADIGNLIKVEVSFTDQAGYLETVTSLPFGPLAEPAGPSGPLSTLVSNTGQSHSATATISKQYAMGFRLGSHGQGYEISSVSIELAAAPSSLTVSLWAGAPDGYTHRTRPQNKLFDFENPPSFKVGLNKFTAPAGAFAYQNVNHFIVLSGFGSELSIKETTSDDEDPVREEGAVLHDKARERPLGSTGQWDGLIDDDDTVLMPAPTSRDSVLRVEVEGSRRDSGILASNYAQVVDEQEIVSQNDHIGIPINLGAADRYLIRGFSWLADATGLTRTIEGTRMYIPPMFNPFDLRSGKKTGSDLGDKLFGLIPTRYGDGINVWTAPQGATVAGSASYLVYEFYEVRPLRTILTRTSNTSSKVDDMPTAEGVSLSDGVANYGGRPLMAFLGEPLDAMVQNLGQSNNSYVSLGFSSFQVLSQGFTTGSDAFGYRLQGVGVNIEGSDAQVPDGPTSVSVAVHADSNGKPGAKLFDLVSPTEFGPGHSFFEAPPGTNLAPNTSYVMVWRYNDGTWHRLQRTSSDSEDSGARTDAGIANVFYRGADLDNLSANSGSNALEFAVYTVVLDKAPFVPGGIPVPLNWLHIPDGAYAGYQFRALFVTHRATQAMSGEIDDYNTWVQKEAGAKYSNHIIEAPKVAEQFRAVVCTKEMDAPTNTGMAGTGVAVHWLNGGWEGNPTLVANSNSQFYGGEWVNTKYGAYVTGNSAYFHKNYMIWTGCDSVGDTHPEGYMGSGTGMVAVGTPRDSDHGLLGPVDDPDFLGVEAFKHRPLYAISPIFTVVGGNHSILPPRNVRGEVDENTLALTLSWDPPRGYEEVDLRYNIWWRNPSSDSAWDPVLTKGARLDPAQFDTGGNRNHGYSEARSAGSLSATTFDYGGVTYTVRTLIDQRPIADSTDTADLTLSLTPQPTAVLDAALTLAFDNGDSVDLDDATRAEVAADAANNVPAYSFYTWINEGIEFQEGVPVLFNFYDGDGNALIDSLTDVVVDGTTWTDDRSDRTYGVQARDTQGRTSAIVRYVIPGGTASGALVKNTGQTVSNPLNLDSFFAKRAQQFTTGADTYTLGSIGFDFGAIFDTSTTGSQLTVTLNADNSGDPGDALCTLTDPTSFTANAVNTFDAPTTCPTLAASTAYFAVIERSAFVGTVQVNVTTSSDDDGGGAAGWSIGDDRHFFGSSMWQSTSSQSYLIEVIGDPN